MIGNFTLTKNLTDYCNEIRMKKNTYNTDGLSAEDRALNTFAELMIEMINNLQEDWKKPWFSPQVAQLPQNLNG